MPALGMAQETGTVIAWMKKEGDTVTKGEPLMEIETDKTTVEIEVQADGILGGIRAAAGTEVPVGETIAWILQPGEEAPKHEPVKAKSSKPKIAARSEGSVPAPPGGPEISPVARNIASEHNIDLNLIQPAGSRIQKTDVLAYLESARVRTNGAGLIPASPKARRLAKERGLVLASISGSGPNGAVISADVLAFQAPAVYAPAEQPISVTKAWRLMADRMTESWRSVPHFFLQRQVNAARFVFWSEDIRKRTGEKVTYTDLLVKVVAMALREHPRLNAAWIDNDIRPNPDINIGLAVATSEALIVPVIHGVDQMSIRQITTRRKEIVERALEKKLGLEDLQGGTFTISNLGMYGVDVFNAIVNPPQAAILAVGRIVEQVVPVNGLPAVQPMLNLSLSSDHRVVDGARAAQFLRMLAGFIEEPLSSME